MSDPERSIQQINQLREMGIRFAIDDFGTGHSSLAYAQNLPVQTLKIDRSFITHIQDASERPPLVENIIRLGHSLNLQVITEGIETAAQHHALLAMGCDEGQGYLYSPPMPATSLPNWEQRWVAPPAPDQLTPALVL